MTDAIASGAIDAALMSATWGAFQMEGLHCAEFGYASLWAMALAAVSGESEHLMMLCGFLRLRGMTGQLRALGGSARSCRPFAEAYCGSGYRRNLSHEKLAAAMRSAMSGTLAREEFL